MNTLSSRQPIASAPVVLFGRHGGVAHHAQARGVSCQLLHREAAALQQTPPVQQQLIHDLRAPRTPAQHPISEQAKLLALSVVLDDDRQANLASVGQAEARLKLDAISNWVRAWQDHHEAGQVEWQERRWVELGRQQQPFRLILNSPDEISVWVGENQGWRLARARYHRLIEQWQALATSLPKHLDVLANYSEQDFERLIHLPAWLNERPQSNLFSRQLPIPGLGSKWLEARRGLITELVGALRHINVTGRDFYG